MLGLCSTSQLHPGRRRAAAIDIGVEAGRIVALEPQLQARPRETIDAAGRLVTPPFVDAHFHMDATLSLRPAAR